MSIRRRFQRIRSATGAIAASLLGTILPSCAPSPTSPGATWEKVVYIDDYAALSYDATMVAFHRRFPSSYGSAGLYVVSSNGGAPRLVVEGDFLWPAELRFSPDGSQILFQWTNRVAVVKLATGAVMDPIPTPRNTYLADWSPDGHAIVYERGRMPATPPEPVDSGGVFILDLASGDSRPLLRNGQTAQGMRPRWSPDGTSISYHSYGDSRVESIIESLPAEGGAPRLLARAPDGLFFDQQQWLPPGPDRPSGVVFRKPTHPQGALFARADGSGTTPWPVQINRFDTVSPDGRWMLRSLPTGDDDFAVIHLGRVNDFVGGSYRPITAFASPE